MTQLRAAAERLIKTIDRNLKKWRLWFPNEQSEVEVPRCDLLALKHYAEIGLADHPADEEESLDYKFCMSLEPTLDYYCNAIEGCWVLRVNEHLAFTIVVDGEHAPHILHNGEIVIADATKGDLRRLIKALQVELREGER